jgi:Domain of unknown function (DUF4178)
MSIPQSSFTCPGCNKKQVLFDAAKVVCYVCGNCNAVLKHTVAGFEKMYSLHSPKRTQLIPLGTTGQLRGQQYTVITYAERFEVGTAWYWEEYTLKCGNSHALAFLSTYGGHWNLLSPINSDPLLTHPAQRGEKTISYHSEVYEQFSVYQAKYNYASGEFNWEADFNRQLKCTEYICPPQMMAIEYDAKNYDEVDLFHGSYIPHREIRQAFPITAGMKPPVGVAPAQPFYGNIAPRRFLIGTLVFCVLALIIQLLYSSNRRQLTVFNESITIDTSTADKPRVTPSFKLEGKMSNLQVEINSNVSNNWCEAEINLVNEQTGKETNFVVGASYYHGYSEGESWSEGDPKQKEFICSVAPGTYHFVVTPTKEATGAPVDLTLTVFWDIPSIWNAGLLCCILAAIAGIIYFFGRRFEEMRWEESNVVKH